MQLAQGEGDERFTGEVVGGVVGSVAGGDVFGQGGVDFGGGDFGGSGLGEAEFAVGQVAFFSARGWAEGAAEDRAMLVEVAGAGGWVEDGAGLVVGEVVEGFGCLVVFGEKAGCGISGEVWGEALDGGGDAVADALGAGGVCDCELAEALAETRGVLLGDGEDADAALGAAGAAEEVMASAAVGIGCGGVDDLDEVGHAAYTAEGSRKGLRSFGDDGLGR